MRKESKLTVTLLLFCQKVCHTVLNEQTGNYFSLPLPSNTQHNCQCDISATFNN